MFCKHCGKQIDRFAKFCRHCGGKISVVDKTDHAVKHCPFCRKEIRADDAECPNCKRILVEKVPATEKYVTDAQKFNNQTKENIISKIINASKKVNYSRLIFNKYVGILLGVIFVVWIFSGDNTSYNSGGTKTPLPAPIQQVSDDVVEFTPTTPAVSLANGTILKKNTAYLYGNGKLHIKNGTSLDVVAKLIRGGTSILTVYIKANSNYTMTSISDGIYWLAFAKGLDWDSTTQKFRRNVQYSSFDETFDFTTTEDYQYIYYPEFEVTLHPVIGGTAETSPADPTQFNAY